MGWDAKAGAPAKGSRGPSEHVPHALMWVPSRVDVGPSVPRRALEADRYNHITATYFLLAERMLREKQEKQGHRLSLVYNLAKEVQSR